MNKIKVDSRKMDIISDFVSKVVNFYENDYMVEGAYVNCRVDECKELTGVDLHIVYIDYRFKLADFSNELGDFTHATGIDLSITQDAYWMYGSGKLKDSDLMTGSIIYDKNGNLTETKRIARLTDVNYGDEVITEPPIQYKKVM